MLPAQRDVVAERVAPEQIFDALAERAGGLQPAVGLGRVAEQARQLGQRLVLEHHEGVGVRALDGSVVETGGEHVGVEPALERAPRQEQAVETGEVVLLPALEGDRARIDAVALGPLGPQRPGAAQRVLRDDRLGRLGLPRLVRQLGAVDATVGVGAVEQAEEAAGGGVPELGVIEQRDGCLARVVVEEPERVVARAEAVTGRRGPLASRRGTGEDPRRGGAQGHGREPRVAEPEVRRANALPGPAPERRPQGRGVGRPCARGHFPAGGGLKPGVAPGVGTGGGAGAFASSSSIWKSSTEPPGMPARGWPLSP